MATNRFRRPLQFAASALLACSAGCNSYGACTLIGCYGGLTVEFNKPAPTTYRVEVTSSPGLGAVYVVECPGGPSCGTGSVMFADYFPSTVTVKVITPLGTTTKTFNPEYTESFPNGRNCGPACSNGKVIVDLPGS